MIKEAFILDENKKDEMQNQDINGAPEEEAAAEQEMTQEPEAQEAPSEEAPTENETYQEGDELEKELEEIRDMFQKELDNAGEEAPIQELEDIAPPQQEEAPEQERRICECCGESACSEEYGEDYPYCDSCRELMKRYPMRASGILMTLVMIAVFILTAYAGTSYIDSFMAVAEAAVYYEDGRVMTGLTAYYNYLSTAKAENISMKAVKDALDGFNKTGYITDAATLIETVYDENDLKLPWNKKYKDTLIKASVITETYNAVAEIVSPALSGEKFDYDEVMAELDALYEKAPTQSGDSQQAKQYNPVFIEYYKYVVMSINEESPEAQLAQLQKVDELGKDGMEWAYLSNYCAVAAKCGDEALVNELFDRLIDINKEDGNAYVAKASYYRWLETPDADKMIEICDMAKENLAAADLSYMPVLATAYLIKGDSENALKTMDEYMSQSAYTVQTCNLYALCAAVAGQEETYKEMKSVLENSGYELSSLVTDYKKGKLTLAQVIADKGGEV